MLNVLCKKLLVFVDSKSRNLWPANGMLATAYVVFELIHGALQVPVSPFSTAGMKQVHLFFGLFAVTDQMPDIEIWLFIGCVMLLSLAAIASLCSFLNWPLLNGKFPLATILVLGLIVWWVYDLLYWSSVVQGGAFMFYPAIFGVGFTMFFLIFRVPVLAILIGAVTAFSMLYGGRASKEEADAKAAQNREDAFLGAVNDDDSTFY